MKLAHCLSLALAIAAVAAPSLAAQNNDSHHPAGAAPEVAGAHVPASTAKSASANASSDIARMDTQMKTMREMHNRMMSAKTPSERNALMAGQMKIMQDGMTMMDGMSAGGMAGSNRDMKGGIKGGMKGDMAEHHRKMEKRMEMMQAMLQMMMDRLPAAPAK